MGDACKPASPDREDEEALSQQMGNSE